MAHIWNKKWEETIRYMFVVAPKVALDKSK